MREIYFENKGGKFINKALLEFFVKEINYDWATLAQLAKDHVNSEQLIKDIYADGYTDGYSEGALEGKT